MDITNVSKMYQAKLQEINSKLPEQTNIKNKFNSYLENVKLKNSSVENIPETEQLIESTNNETDTEKLLSSFLTYNSTLNSNSSLFSNTSSENNIFPSMNNSLQILQQSALLKSLKKDSEN